MGSAAILVISSSATLPSRCAIRSSGAKDCWGVPYSGNGDCRCSTSSVPGIARVGGNTEKCASDGSNRNRSVVADAALGRFSGAIHKNSQRTSRRRRPPAQQQDEDEETACSSKDPNSIHIEEQPPDAAFGIASTVGAIHDDGSWDGSEDSHERYLQELGVSTRVDGQSQTGSRELPGNVGDVYAHSSPYGSPQLSERLHLQKSAAFGPRMDNDVAGGGHIDYNRLKKAKGKQVRDAATSGRARIAKKTSVATTDCQGETGRIFVDEIAALGEPLDQHPVQVPVTSSSKVVDENEEFQDGGQGTERNAEIENGREVPGASDSGLAPASKKHAKKLRAKAAFSSSGLTFEEKCDNKHVRVSMGGAERPAIPLDLTGCQSESRPERVLALKGSSTPLKLAEEFGTGVNVGADDETGCQSEYRPEQVLALNDSITALKLAEEFGPEVNVGADEETGCQSESRPEHVLASNSSVAALEFAEEFGLEVNVGADDEEVEKATSSTTNLGFWGVVEPAHWNGQSVSGSAGTVGEVAAGLDFNSMNGTTNEDKSSELTLKDRSLIIFCKAGASLISLPVAADDAEELVLSRGASLIVEQSVRAKSHVVEALLEQAVQVVEQAAEVGSKVAELPVVVVERAAQIGSHVAGILPEVVTEQAGQVVEEVADFQTQVAEQVSSVTEQVIQLGQKIVDQVSEAGDSVVEQVTDVTEQVASTVNEQVQQVAESVSSTASQVAEQVTSSVDTVTTTASQVVDQVTDFLAGVAIDEEDYNDDSDSDDDFEAYRTSDLPEFRGKQGLDNFIVKQEDHGFLSSMYYFYSYMLKQPLPKFAVAMFSAPIIVSAVFTLLYLPQFEGLAFDETARDFFAAAGIDASTLQISGKTVFQVYMFSLSLSTGLQPELAPLSPYTLVVANANALVGQLVFVFLSGAVFARLSQPSQPVRCSNVALVFASVAQRRRKENGIKVFMARYVLAGPQPCELVDVKVDLTYKYNTLTRTGSFFRATLSLKLVRSEIAFLTHGMLVRHVIDDSSPLYQRTPEMLNKEDAVFSLTVVGLERASMQSVFHVQHYCVVDGHVIWDAEFEDIILINKKNKRVVDHSRLSMWKPFTY